MMPRQLTHARHGANTPPMEFAPLLWSGFGRRAARAVLMVSAMAAGSGCISVSAPDKPIVIELNINIKQEVIYRLADDVRSNIAENPEIF